MGKKKCILGLWVPQAIWILLKLCVLYPKCIPKETPQYRLPSFWPKSLQQPCLCSKSIFSKAIISRSNIALRGEHKSLLCPMGSQWFKPAPGSKCWSTLFYHQKTQGSRWAFQKPSPFHKKCLYKQIKPRQTLQVSAQLRDRCLSPPYPKE